MTSTGRYARPEYERRFLLAHVPDDARDPRHIVDRFLDGTRLRLRIVTDPDSGDVRERKLGHKVRPDEDDPTTVWHTSLYLDPREAATFAELPGTEVVKTRYRWSHDGHDAAVDHYHQGPTELVVAELVFDDPVALAAYAPTEPLGAEVTHVAAMTGPALALRA